ATQFEQGGELKLSTPIGNTLGLLQWSPQEATLQDGSRVQRYDSIDLLLTRVTGAALPVDALFDWLSGRPTAVPGWRPQLAQVSDGRLQATRESPAPTAELRVIFEPAPRLPASP
ncbi:MAG: outer membrane lipoprotein LolB, partial [Comamonadaceae bacterium]